MYVSLVEILHTASDLKTRKRLLDTVLMESVEETPRAAARMHKRRAEALAEGREVRFVRTAVRWDDPRRENPRRKRRAFQRIMRRLMRRVRKPSAKRQAEVDAEVDKMFTESGRPAERRTKSGLVIPRAK